MAVQYFRLDPPAPERLFRVDLETRPLTHDRLDPAGWVSIPGLLSYVLTDDNLGWTEIDAAEAALIAGRVAPGVPFT